MKSSNSLSASRVVRSSVPLRALSVIALLLVGVGQNALAGQQSADDRRGATALTGGAKVPAIPLTAQGLDERYEFVGHLIEHSTAARRVDLSGMPEARQLQQQASELREKARAAIISGRLDEASGLLQESTGLMIKAVRLAQPEEVSSEKNRTDFNKRRESARALLATGKRVAAEKGEAKPELLLAETLLADANRLVGVGDVGGGSARLDHAYRLIRTSLLDMRNGDELFVQKNFASAQDEYRYEQARNADYQRLISDIVQGQASDPSWSNAARRGRVLRDEADSIARAQDFDGALKKIDASTKLLKGILRRAGLEIVDSLADAQTR